ncbi:hypothetical protein AOLI_G00298100 [Acnodon oligacanthus]
MSVCERACPGCLHAHCSSPSLLDPEDGDGGAGIEELQFISVGGTLRGGLRVASPPLRCEAPGEAPRAVGMAAKERLKSKMSKDSVTLLPCFYFVELPILASSVVSLYFLELTDIFKPVHSGYSCNDRSLSMPYIEPNKEVIPFLMLFSLAFVGPAATAVLYGQPKNMRILYSPGTRYEIERVRPVVVIGIRLAFRLAVVTVINPGVESYTNWGVFGLDELLAIHP